MAISIKSALVAAGAAALLAGCVGVPYDNGYGGYGYNDPYAYNDYPGYGYNGPGYAEPGPSVGIGLGFWDSDHHWHRGDRDADRDHDGRHFDRGHDGRFDRDRDGDHGRGGDHGDRGHDDHGSGG